MEKAEIESLLIDYIDGKLNEAEKQVVENELMKDEVHKLHEQLKEVMGLMDRSEQMKPPASIKKNFALLLHSEVEASRKTKTVFFHTFYKVAAAVALLIIGGGIGFWINKQQQQQNQLAALQKETERTKYTLMSMLDNQQSASQRVLGANVAYRMDKPDDEIVYALVNTMNEDPSTNVRLAALEALAKFRHQKHVRKALIESLTTQNDPMIQITLIRLMVEMKEKEVMTELERMTTDEQILPAVKDEAHAGLLRLS
jgi:hypothetical protein